MDGRSIAEIQREHRELLADLEMGQKEMSHGMATQSRVDDLTQKAKRAEELQGYMEQHEMVSGAVKRGQRIPERTMPVGPEQKGLKRVRTTPGHLFVTSDQYKQWKAMGAQSGFSGQVGIKSIRGGVVELVGDEAEKFEVKAYDPATLSDLGTDAIIPYQRDPDLVRYEEPEILTIRDLLQVLPATSDTIRYVRHTATDRAAESQWDGEAEPAQRRGGLKPYLRIDATAVNVPVETIAVLSKVTEQDVQDAPRLAGIINSEMRLDIRVEEERQLLYGTGATGELSGIFPAITAQEFARSEVGDTLIDTIRRMRTDLRKRRIIPTGLAVDPIDWENVELTKSTDDDHYIWAVVTDARGPRIWSIRVVESDAMTNPTTGERRILMGDFGRGATLYDRHDVRLAVGFVDDDFARNLRTLRAEERVALAVKRPYAFTWATTDEGGS